MSSDGLLFADERNEQTVSEALEYAVIMRCVALMANLIANRRGSSSNEAIQQAERFDKLSRVYRRLWNNRTGYYSGFLRDGTRVNQDESGPFHASSLGLYTEGSAIQWLFHVMHDFEGLLDLMGRPLLEKRMNQLFTRKGTSAVSDVTGLIGSYAQGNEPSHHGGECTRGQTPLPQGAHELVDAFPPARLSFLASLCPSLTQSSFGTFCSATTRRRTGTWSRCYACTLTRTTVPP